MDGATIKYFLFGENIGFNAVAMNCENVQRLFRI